MYSELDNYELGYIITSEFAIHLNFKTWIILLKIHNIAGVLKVIPTLLSYTRWKLISDKNLKSVMKTVKDVKKALFAVSRISFSLPVLVLKHQKTKAHFLCCCLFPYESRNRQVLGIIFQRTFLVYHFSPPYLFFSNWLVSLGSRYISDMLGCLLFWHMHSYTDYLCINVSNHHHIFPPVYMFLILYWNTHAKQKRVHALVYTEIQWEPHREMCRLLLQYLSSM